MSTGLSGSVTILFLILIKVLFVTFVLGLVVGIIVLIKDTLFTDDDKAKIKGVFTVNQKATVKKTCANCEKEIKTTWKACPYCGRSIESDIIHEAECKSI
jgi:aspartate carbamoyltransferase regulatory subunit